MLSLNRHTALEVNGLQTRDYVGKHWTAWAHFQVYILHIDTAEMSRPRRDMMAVSVVSMPLSDPAVIRTPTAQPSQAAPARRVTISTQMLTSSNETLTRVLGRPFIRKAGTSRRDEEGSTLQEIGPERRPKRKSSPQRTGALQHRQSLVHV